MRIVVGLDPHLTTRIALTVSEVDDEPGYLLSRSNTAHEWEVRTYVVMTGIPPEVSLPSFINELEPFWPSIRRLRCVREVDRTDGAYAVLAEMTVVEGTDEHNAEDMSVEVAAVATDTMHAIVRDLCDEFNRPHVTLGDTMRVRQVANLDIVLMSGSPDDGNSEIIAALDEVLGGGEEGTVINSGSGSPGSLSLPSSASTRQQRVPVGGAAPAPSRSPQYPSSNGPYVPKSSSPQPTPITSPLDATAGGGEGLCSICLERLYTFPCITTLCCHPFHIHCYSRTLPQCPLCRFDACSNPPQPDGPADVLPSVTTVAADADDAERIAAFRQLFRGSVSVDRLGSGMGPATPTSLAAPAAALPSSVFCVDCRDGGDDDSRAEAPEDGGSVPLWMCLLCGHVGCASSHRGHSRAHYELHGHRFAIDVYGPRVWDYSHETFVHRIVQQAVMSHTSSDDGINNEEGRCAETDAKTGPLTDKKAPAPMASSPPPSGRLWVDYGFNDHDDRARLLSSVDLVADFYSKLLNHQLHAQQTHYESIILEATQQGDIGTLLHQETRGRQEISRAAKKEMTLAVVGLKDALQAIRKSYTSRARTLELSGSTAPASQGSAGLETDRIAVEAARKNLASLNTMYATLQAKEQSHAAACDNLKKQVAELQAETERLMERF